MLAGKEGFSKFGSTLANTLGFGTQPRTSPDVPQLGTLQAGVATTTHHRRDWGILRLLLLAIAGAVVLLALAKMLVRGSRFLTRDPRRLAGACRKELRDFLLDQGVDVPASATLSELAALVEYEFRRRGRGVRAARDRGAVRATGGCTPGGPRDAPRAAGGAARDPADAQPLGAPPRAALVALAGTGVGRDRRRQVRFT